MKRITGFAVCFIMSLMLLGIGSSDVMAAEYDAITPALSQAIEGAMQQANVTGLSVALVDDQEIVWAEGFGYADKANEVKATPETLYRVASVSKLLTATAIMQLVERGEIDLDQPLQTYLPEFSVKSRFPDADPITVRHLLTHHSGLPSDWINGMQTLGENQQALIERTFASLLDEIKDTYVANPPNTVFSYSNLGYSILGHVVEHVSGQEFSAYVDEALLKPLGMSASSFAFTPAMSSSLSKEYQNGEQQEFNWSRDIPAAMLHSTVLDLGQFMSMMFADGKAGSQHILQPQTVAEMWRPQNDNVPLDFDARWGLSWWLLDIGVGYAGKMAWHSGNVGMWNSLLVTLPEHKLGVVMLSNSGGAGAINFQIAPKILEHALEAKTGITRPPVEPLELVTLSPDDVRSYEGLYTTESLGPIVIRGEGTNLYAEAMGNSFKLLHHGEGRFSIEGVGDAELAIKTVNNRTALKLQGMAVGGLGFGERIEPGPIPEAWQNRLGAYEIINGNPDYVTFLTDIQLKDDRQVLIFDVLLPLLGMQVGLPMKPLSDTEVITLGLGRNCGETISVVEVDGEEHLFYSGYLMKKTGSVEKKPAAGNVYEDPQGRFSMPLVGDWTQLETDGTYGHVAFAEPPLDMYVVTVETDDLAAGADTALRQVGIDPAELTLTDAGDKFGPWDLSYYSRGDDKGVTVTTQVRDETTYVIIITGDFVHTTTVPDHVVRTVGGFALSGEVVLPATVEEFEAYVGDVVGDIPPGLSIAIALGKDVIYAKGFGMADGPLGMAAAEDTVYQWGSVAKIVTAVAIMQLSEQGLIDLDAPVSDYLDYFPTDDGITVRHLLSHSAGLPDPPNHSEINVRLDGQPLADSDLIDRKHYEEFTGPSFEPGSTAAYGNVHYVTLGQVVAAVSGQSFVEYVQEHILAPLGMQNTDFSYSSAAMIARAAAGAVPVAAREPIIIALDETRGLGDGADYFRETDERHAWMNRYNVLAAHGGLIGPATEVIRLGQMFLNEGELDGARVLSPESVALMQEIQISTDGDPLGYALGWEVFDTGNHPHIAHPGGGSGLQALLRLYPAEGFAIALMSNAGGYDYVEVADAAANVVFTMMGGGAQQEAPAPASAPPSAQAGNVYEDPQGRFSMPLIGAWTQVETDKADALFEVSGLDLNMYVVTVASENLEAGGDAALKQIGINSATLTQMKPTVKFARWNIILYSQGDGKGVTVLARVKEDTTYCLILTGDEGLTPNPPDHVFKTFQEFTFSGEELVLPTTVEEFEAYINSFVGDIPPGLSIEIALNGDILYAKGFGMADGPNGMPARPDTVYMWGSMTKIVTATAIMQLVDQGLVDPDAPVSDYLDYVPAEYGITIRHLFTHSAGLPEPSDFVVGNLRLEGQALPDPDLFARGYFEDFSGPMFEPGSASSYSSPGIVLLGQIVAEVSGQPYIEYVREHILAPLGMNNTDCTYSTEVMTANAATPAFPPIQVEDIIAVLDRERGLGDGADFIREVDDQHAWMNRYYVFGAGGCLIGPATEVMRLAQMHLNGGELDGVRVLSPEAVALMQEMQYSTQGDPFGWGLGWIVTDEGEHPYVEHDGGGVGIWDKMRLYPQDGLAIVLMSNASGWEKDRVADAAANVVFTMLGGGAQQETQAPANALPSAQTGNVYEDPQGRFSFPLIGDWTPVETDGTYVQAAYADMPLHLSLVTVESDDLEAGVDVALRQVGIDPAALTETSRSRWDKWEIVFYTLGDGQGVSVLGQTRDGTSYLFVGTGDEALTARPPEDVLMTIQGFSLSGEVSLPATVEAFETYVNSFVGATPPGLSTAIALKDDVIYQQGFGIADGPLGTSATSDTVYHWASVTKTVTVTAIMQLREQGLIDLDAPVSDYLDYFPTQYPIPITARHMLTHSTGLPEPTDYLMKHLRLQGQPLPDFDAVDREYYEGVPSLMFDTGSQSAYVNPDYVTLGQIVAAVSGQPYVEYVREHILNPLRMTNTDFTYSNDFMETNAAAPTIPVAEAEALASLLDEARGLGDGADFFRKTDENDTWWNHYMVGESAGGGLIGPATDMIRFAQMMLNEGELDGIRILTAESVALLQEVQPSTSGEPLDIGLAWHFGGDAGHPYIEHDGGGPFPAKLRLYMQDGLAIAVMANGAGFDRNEFADAAANVVFTMMGGGAQQEAPAVAFTPPITDAEGNEIPGSIAAIKTVTLGGVEQTVTLRGVDTSNPVLLFLHGGPGVPSSPWVSWNNFQAELEANFVVVHWDQRGAGKSFSEALTPEDMRLEHFVSDTLALTDILRERFGQDKIFLWGHSWGSALGFETLRVNAEPYHAYIASAVRPDWNSTQTMGYEWVLEQARQAKDSEAIQALESIQPFDPANREHINMRAHFLSLYRGGDFHTEGLEKAWLDYALSGRSPEYPAADVEKTMKGLDFTRQTISLEILQSGYDLFRDFPESPIPVYFLAGRHDHETPGELAEDYYNVLEAPAKHFTWFENSAHNMMYDEPDKTNQELIRIAKEILNP